MSFPQRGNNGYQIAFFILSYSGMLDKWSGHHRSDKTSATCGRDGLGVKFFQGFTFFFFFFTHTGNSFPGSDTSILTKCSTLLTKPSLKKPDVFFFFFIFFFLNQHSHFRPPRSKKKRGGSSDQLKHTVYNFIAYSQRGSWCRCRDDNARGSSAAHRSVSFFVSGE